MYLADNQISWGVHGFVDCGRTALNDGFVENEKSASTGRTVANAERQLIEKSRRWIQNLYLKSPLPHVTNVEMKPIQCLGPSMAVSVSVFY